MLYICISKYQGPLPATSVEHTQANNRVECSARLSLWWIWVCHVGGVIIHCLLLNCFLFLQNVVWTTSTGGTFPQPMELICTTLVNASVASRLRASTFMSTCMPMTSSHRRIIPEKMRAASSRECLARVLMKAWSLSPLITIRLKKKEVYKTYTTEL